MNGTADAGLFTLMGNLLIVFEALLVDRGAYMDPL